jgi:hypothetical protein
VRFVGARGTLVAEATAGGRQRLVEAAGRARATVGALGAFSAARRTVAEFAFGRGAFAAFVARSACRTVRAVAVAGFDRLREAAFAAFGCTALAFEAARRAVAARPTLAAATVLRGATVAAEARAVGCVAFTAFRSLATRSAFRRTACAWTSTAERTAFAVVAARGAITKAARSAFAAIRTAFEPAGRTFGSVTGFTARRAVTAIGSAFEAARGAFAAIRTAFKATWRTFTSIACTFKTTWRAIGAVTTALEPARSPFAALTATFEAARSPLAAIASAFKTARRATGTATATLKPTRRALAALAVSPARCAFATIRTAFKSTRCALSSVPTRGAVATTFKPARAPFTLSLTRRALATITTTFKPTRRALTIIPTRRTTRALATRRPIRRRAMRATGVPLARKRSFSPCRTRRTRAGTGRLADARRPLAAARRASAFTPRPARSRRRRPGAGRARRLTRRRAAGTDRGAFGRSRPRVLGC